MHKRLVMCGLIFISLTRLALPATIYSTLEPGNTWSDHGALSVIAGVEPHYPAYASAWSFTAPGNITVDGVDLPLGKWDHSGLATGNSVVLEFCADSAGVPGTVLRSVLVSDGTPTITGTYAERVASVALVRFTFSTTLNLVNGSTYWVVLRTLAGDPTWAYWASACQTGAMPGVGKMQIGANPWQAMSMSLQQIHNGITENCPSAFRVTSP